ncbi:MAG: hypothetical protein CVU47_09180 [Chloroflexi bacterium HGW-Chloroflexi-9]|nr:MAG: hypothetical protein CVU47_09180 [Chloroflexi bacterium HGW-Chloroflexi-9]
MRRLLTSFSVLLMLLVLLGGQPSAVSAAGCTGRPELDARVPGCGLSVPVGATSFRWERPATLMAQAFDAGRVSPPSAVAATSRLQVWSEHPRTGAWTRWTPSTGAAGMAGFTTLVPGQVYWIQTETAFAWSFGATPQRSVFADAQVVSFYGFPGIPFMGVLGKYSAAEAATRVTAVASQYDALNGSRKVIPALHLIAAVAQRYPGASGLYLGRISAGTLDEYVRVTEEHGMLLFLDVQVGWANPLTEVQALERVLLKPHVHVALDPEFATRTDGEPPGVAIGSLDASEVNAVQDYLGALAAQHALPPKVLVIHQFRADMLVNPERISSVPGVDLVIDMDGWGPRAQKLWGYQTFANASYAPFAGFKLFYDWDVRLFSPAEIQQLQPGPPDLIIYQ